MHHRHSWIMMEKCCQSWETLKTNRAADLEYISFKSVWTLPDRGYPAHTGNRILLMMATFLCKSTDILGSWLGCGLIIMWATFYFIDSQCYCQNPSGQNRNQSRNLISFISSRQCWQKIDLNCINNINNINNNGQIWCSCNKLLIYGQQAVLTEI